MGKNLYLHQLALRPTDVVVAYKLHYLSYLAQRQLSCRDHHVGKLCKETHSLSVAYVALRRNMHLHANAVRVCNHCHIAGNDGTHPHTLGGIHQPVHLVYLAIIDNSVDCQVGAHTGTMGNRAYPFQVLQREVGRRTRPHIQVADAKIYGISSALYCRLQALVRAHRCHYFYLVSHCQSIVYVYNNINSQISVPSGTRCSPRRLQRYAPQAPPPV